MKKFIMLLLLSPAVCASMYAQSFVAGGFEGCHRTLVSSGNFAQSFISEQCGAMGFTFSGEGLVFYSDGSQGTEYGSASNCYYNSPNPSEGERCAGLGNNTLIALQLTEPLRPGQCYTITYKVINSTGDDGGGNPCATSEPAQLSFGMSNSATSFGTLLNESAAFPTQLYQWTDGTVLFTAPDQTENFITIQLTDQANDASIFFLDNLTITPVPCSTPVHFGKLNAAVKDNQLIVTWQTASETNNKFFDVETSTNGVDFKPIARVNSKAPNGNSSAPIQYAVSSPLNTALAAVGAGILALLMFPSAAKKRRIWLIIAVLGTAFLGAASCNKADKEHGISAHEKIYVRIVQTDINGKQSHSEITEAIWE